MASESEAAPRSDVIEAMVQAAKRKAPAYWSHVRDADKIWVRVMEAALSAALSAAHKETEMSDRPDDPIEFGEIVEAAARKLCESDYYAWDKLSPTQRERYCTEAAEKFAVIQSALLQSGSGSAIDQARREGYAAGVRAAAEVMETGGAFMDWVPQGLRDTMRMETAAAIRALIKEEDGV